MDNNINNMNNKSTEFAAVGLAFSKGLKGMNKSRIDGGYSEAELEDARMRYEDGDRSERIMRILGKS
ncbi:MAG: hypothetical protein ACI4EW_00770 [Butyrivibrio sp.]